MAQSSLLSSSSSSDDSFVHIEMRPALCRNDNQTSAFGNSKHTASGSETSASDRGNDATYLLSQCKAAPSQLKSFEPALPDGISQDFFQKGKRRPRRQSEQ